MQLLTFTLNGAAYGISLKDVESIETKMEVLAIPTSPAHIRGIINLHGNIVPVYSLVSRFGQANMEVGNIIVVRSDDVRVGLEVEQVKEIINIPDDGVISMPVIMQPENNCFQNVASSEGQGLLAMLDVRQLMPTEEKQELKKIVANAQNNA
jgi:purine-binding chemotaxis protein CheW